MAITEQHFQRLNTTDKNSADKGPVIHPSWVSVASWLSAITTAVAIDGVAGLLAGGLVLFAVPAAWMAFEIHRSAADTQA